MNNYNSNRVGFFAAPFLLGTIVGGGAVSLFNPYRPRPVYYTNSYYPGGYYPYY